MNDVLVFLFNWFSLRVFKAVGGYVIDLLGLLEPVVIDFHFLLECLYFIKLVNFMSLLTKELPMKALSI